MACFLATSTSMVMSLMYKGHLSTKWYQPLDPLCGVSRALWYVCGRTFPFDFDKKVKYFLETCHLHHNYQRNLKIFRAN